jgi:nicotinic acid mononucleotide adenylyltransferase
MCTLVLAVREGDASAVRHEIDEKKKLYVEKYGAKVAELSFEPFPISSTELRAKIAAGEECGAYIPRDILDFIEEKGLYR